MVAKVKPMHEGGAPLKSYFADALNGSNPAHEASTSAPWSRNDSIFSFDQSGSVLLSLNMLQSDIAGQRSEQRNAVPD